MDFKEEESSYETTETVAGPTPNRNRRGRNSSPPNTRTYPINAPEGGLPNELTPIMEPLTPQIQPVTTPAQEYTPNNDLGRGGRRPGRRSFPPRLPNLPSSPATDQPRNPFASSRSVLLLPPNHFYTHLLPESVKVDPLFEETVIDAGLLCSVCCVPVHIHKTSQCEILSAGLLRNDALVIRDHNFKLARKKNYVGRN